MNIERGKKYALNLLGLRMYTCSEVYERLIRKGAEKEDAEEIIGWLMSLGYLDDKKYAEYYIEDAINLSNKGIYRIKQELYKKGIARSIVDEAAENTEVSVIDSLTEYVRRKYGENLELSYKEMTKLKAHLARRGFSYGDILECLDILEIKTGRSEEY
mgnify:FL=1